MAYSNLGVLLEEQGDAMAYSNLGILLEDEPQDVDGAEEAYRAAIKADPGCSPAHINLATLLYFKRAKKAEAEGDLAKAAALYDEVIKHYTLSKGPEHEWTREAKADAARVRAALSRTGTREGGRRGAGTGKRGGR